MSEIFSKNVIINKSDTILMQGDMNYEEKFEAIICGVSF